ncbi:hypothetical protein C8R45DRAFT_350677 [Mycena sanguinolenta]|nr:hypothetical protein C8R45DRAFT_350677 [Mycena sanguinolenta]
MQELSLRRYLDIRQTFTVFHDKHAAWSGPGSALGTLYGQRRLQTAFSSLFFIGLYVFGASALHVTTPSFKLASLATSNKTSAGYADLYTSRPDHPESDVLQSGVLDAISILPALPLLQNVNATAGLYGNIIFDTPAQIYQAYGDGPLAEGFQVPNVAIFNVTCGNLVRVEQVVWETPPLGSSKHQFATWQIAITTHHGIRFRRTWSQMNIWLRRRCFWLRVSTSLTATAITGARCQPALLVNWTPLKSCLRSCCHCFLVSIFIDEHHCECGIEKHHSGFH